MNTKYLALVAALAVMLVASTALATTDNVFAGGHGHKEKVTVCHRPPGNPENGKTLELPVPAANAHLTHHPGDTLGPCESPPTATLIVFKVVRCDGSMFPEDCPNLPLPDPSDFTMNVIGENPDPSSFEGSAEGTLVTLEPGDYSTSQNAPNTPPNFSVIVTFSPGCFSSDSGGPIQAGEERTCTWTSDYSPFT